MTQQPSPPNRGRHTGETLIDISPPITPDLAVFPGDTPPTREVLLDMAKGENLTLSTLRSTVHLGSHADGINHYAVDGASIDEMPLERYIGPCTLVRVSGTRGRRVANADLPIDRRLRRILIATGTQPDKRVFNTDFSGLEPTLIHRLADLGVRTIGIDTPSVDMADSKDLPAHGACLERGIAIIEGLVLDEIPDGDYELIAPPLKLVGFDGSPVRAVLRRIAQDAD